MIKLSLFVAAVVLSAVSFSAQALYTIQFSHVVAPGTPKGKAADYLASLVNERLKGKVKMVVYPNSQLYNDNKVMEAMRFNSGDTGMMAAPSLSKFVKLSRTLQAFDLPFLFKDIEDVHTLVDSPLAQRMTAPLERKGIKAMAFWDNGMKVFSIKGDKPLRMPGADFAGKKFRVQTSKVHEEMIKALGGSPQPLPFKEVYTALAQGVVDGQENAWSNIRSKKFFEVQDYLTVSNHSYLGYLLVISNDFWEQLPADIQTELSAAIKETTLKAREFAAEADAADKAAIIEAKGADRVLGLTDQERAAWVKATSKVEDKFSRRIGLELLAEIHRLLGH